MHSLTHAAAITEGKAMNIIFDACRANTARNTVEVHGYVVSFEIEGQGHKATVKDANGFPVAFASVDYSDR